MTPFTMVLLALLGIQTHSILGHLTQRTGGGEVEDEADRRFG